MLRKCLYDGNEDDNDSGDDDDSITGMIISLLKYLFFIWKIVLSLIFD